MPHSNITDTICAIATPPGISAIGVVKLSGSHAIQIVEEIFRPAKAIGKLSEARPNQALYGRIMRESGELLDDAVAVVYRAPHSYTGEDVVELSCHGSTYILSEVMKLLISRGCRLAEGGEFTRRAFANGKMDLSRAEAVADVIASNDRNALNIALSQMRGDFSKKINELRESLIRFASLIELELDFSEEDVEFVDRHELIQRCAEIERQVSALAGSFERGQALKNGIPIAIAGMTNAGKSTLLNGLIGDDRAIVSDIHGTTRDTIEECIVLDGKTFRLIDTAGLRETEDCIERLGIERTRKSLKEAALTLWLIDPQSPKEDLRSVWQSISELTRHDKIVPIVNKIDVRTANEVAQIKTWIAKETGIPTLTVLSAQCEKGIETVRDILRRSFESYNVEQGDLVVTNLRQATALQEAATHLAAVQDGLSSDLYSDLIAQDLRAAINALATVTGAISTDSLLQSIFSHFCIGK